MKKTIFVLSLIFLFKSLSCQNNLTGIWVSNYKETIEIKQINQVLNITLSDNEGVREISDLENSNGVFIGKMNFISRKLRCFQKLTIIEPNILLSEYTNCSDCVNRLSTFWIKSNRQYDNLSSNEINNFYEKFLALLRDYGEKNKYAYAFEAAYKISNDLKDKQKFEKFNEIDNNNVSIKSNEINKDVSIKKEQIVPPMLSVSNIAFTDKNSNNRIDGNEECSINFTITNKGKGAARNMKIIVQNNSTITGLIFTTTTTLELFHQIPLKM